MAKTLLSEIREVVKEELGISTDVSRYTREIFKDIITDAKMNGVYVRRYIKAGKFFHTIDGFIINIDYNIIYLNNMNELDPSDCAGETKFIPPKYFNLEISLVYDKSRGKYIDLYGNLQHEIEHIYQQIRAGKEPIDRPKTKEMYNTARRLMLNAKTRAEMVVGSAIYYNCRFEQDAYANDIYKMIMDNPDDNPYEVLKNSVSYYNVNYIRRAVLVGDNSSVLEPVVKEYFGKSYSWFHRLTKHMVSEYMRRVGKALAKALKDIETKK